MALTGRKGNDNEISWKMAIRKRNVLREREEARDLARLDQGRIVLRIPRLTRRAASRRHKGMNMKRYVIYRDFCYLTASAKWTSNRELAYVFETTLLSACELAARHGGEAVEVLPWRP